MSTVKEKIVLLKLNDKKEQFTTVPKSMQNEVKKRIGSEFKPGTRDTIRGLNYEQERIYLPNILGIHADDNSFPFRAKDFWSDFSITPTVEGIPLNIATTPKVVKVKRTLHNGDTEEVEETIEIPVDWDSYVTYQFAMASRRVAKTEHDLANLGFYDFYLVDLHKEKEQKEKDFESQDKADSYYVRLTIDGKWEQNESKINWIIELLRDKRISSSIDTMSRVEKKMMLSEFKSKTPLLFISTVDKDNLELEAFMSTCITNGILKKEGNSYFNKDEAIGSSEETAIAWFKNPINSGKYQAIKARLDDVLKNKRQ